MSNTGICTVLRYVAPKKRKPVSHTYAAESKEASIAKAMADLKAHGGKFVSGYTLPCSFSDLPTGVRMFSTSMMQQGIKLTDEELQTLNKV